MTSPDDLNPPSYLRSSPISDPFTSPPPRRKPRFTTPTSTFTSTSNTKTDTKTNTNPRRTSVFNPYSPPPLILPPPAVTTHYTQRSPLHTLRMQSKHLTTHLQTLLDAQSTALLSAGTPTSHNNTTKSPKTTLADARTGITTAMTELASIRESEAAIYDAQISDRQELMHTLSTWGSKSRRLEGEIAGIENGSEGQRLEELRGKKGALEEKIEKLRLKLAGLEDELAAVSIQLAETDSVVASKASSYKASLATIKSKTSSFLATHKYASPSTAIESWTRECEALSQKAEQAQTEGAALREGVLLWDDTLALVAEFENTLRTRMKGNGAKGSNVKELILGDLEAVISRMQEILAVAEQRGWKLLCCCVGAELQVFLEGREMVRRGSESADSASVSGSGKRSSASTPISSPTVMATATATGKSKSTESNSEDANSSSNSGADERLTQSRSSLRAFGARKGLSLRKSLASPSPKDSEGKERESVDLLLKVDNVGDGAGDGKPTERVKGDYSPLDD